IRWSGWLRTGVTAAALAGVLLTGGCSDNATAPAIPAKSTKGGPGSIGVVILVDTSGSMKDSVPDKDGKKRPKYQLANEALAEILRQTGDWAKDHPDKPLNLAIYHFSDKSKVVLPLGEFDGAAAQAAVKAIPHPDGGTAIGLALQDAWKAL